MVTTKRISAVLLASVVALTGCATTGGGNLGNSSYERSEVRGEMAVRYGVVRQVRQVEIAGTKSGVGAVGGAIVGGILGSNIGKGRGRTAGTVAGAVAGGFAGNAIENGTSARGGLEITVRLDNGQVSAFVQEDTGERFFENDRIRVVGSGANTRVTH